MYLPSLLVVGMPGGIELLVVLFVLFVLFGVPATLLVLLGYKHLRDSTDSDTDERLSELESEIEQLKARLEAEEE